jgi:hypothetical protein
MSWSLCRRILLFLNWALIVIVPLGYSTQTLRAFDLVKAYHLKLGSIILLTLFTVTVLLFKRWELFHRIRYLIYLFAAFILSSLIATFFSTNSWMSLYGVYERQVGLQGIYASMAIALMLFSLIEEKKEILYSLLSVALVGSIVGLQGALVKVGINPTSIPEMIDNHLTGIMGHHNFLGNFLAVTAPVTLGLSYLYRQKIGLSLLFGFGFFVQFVSLYYTITRGALLAFLVGVFSLIFVFSIKKIQEKRIKYARYTLLLFVAGFCFVSSSFIVVRFNSPLMAILFAIPIIGFLYLSFRQFLKFKLFSQKFLLIFLSLLFISSIAVNSGIRYYQQNHLQNPALKKTIHRYYSIFTLKDSATPRFQLWRETLGFLPKKPIFGIGIETFRREFMAHKSAYLESLERHTNYDNPHNSYFYYLASLGILGSLPYFLIHLLILSALMLMLFKHQHQLSSYTLVFFGYFSAYWISSIPGFDVVSTLMIFWVMVGLFFRYLSFEEDMLPLTSKLSQLETEKGLKTATAISLTLLMALGLYTIPNSYQYYQADKHMKATQYWIAKRNLPRALKHITEARKLNPKEHFYIKTKGEILYAFARGQKTRDRMYQFVVKAEQELNSGLTHSWAPENLYIAKINGRMLLKDYAGALRACDKALFYSPHLKQIKDLKIKLKQLLLRGR